MLPPKSWCHIGSAAFLWSLAVLVGAMHALTGLSAKIGECTTSDEIAYVTAGHVYWHDGDFRLQPENGVLPQELAGVATLVTPWHMPPAADPSWAQSNVWRLGTEAFYHASNNTDYVLFLARAFSSLHVIALLLLVFGWSYRLFGLAGATLSTTLFATDPNFLAHGTLATSDVAAAFWLLAATGAYWRFLQQPTWKRGLLSGLCLGLAAVTKYSVVLLGPVFGLLWLIGSVWQPGQRRNGGGGSFGRRMLWLGGTTVAQIPIALVVIWVCYGWHAHAFTSHLGAGEYYHPWSEVLAQLGSRRGFFLWLRDSHLVPDAYAYGLSNVIAFSQGRAAFLAGAVSMSGWPQFFPYAFLVKTPLPLLAAVLISLVAGAIALREHNASASSRRSALYPLVPLAIFVVVYGAASVVSHLNIGLRHLLPIYGPLFIVAGYAGKALWSRRAFGRGVFVGLIGWTATVPALVWPNFIAYFNPIAGGPAHGYRRLVDSSLDWGQDLPRVAQWLHRHRQPGASVALSYFGLGDPDYEGIVARPLPSLPQHTDPYPNTLQPGLYLVSATMLQQVFNLRGAAWSLDDERRYQSLRTLEILARAWETSSADHRSFERQFWTDSKLRRAWTEYEELRFARLCQYLRVREPDAEIGYSVLVYHLTPEQLREALEGKLSDLLDLIEKTTSR